MFLSIDGLRLKISLYSKPTDAHSYLLPTSSPKPRFPKYLLQSMPSHKEDLFSENKDAEKHIQDLQNHLSKRGYDPKLVDEPTEKAESMDRTRSSLPHL